MSTIIDSLTTEQFDAIIAAYGTILEWIELVANSTVSEDIVF